MAGILAETRLRAAATTQLRADLERHSGISSVTRMDTAMLASKRSSRKRHMLTQQHLPCSCSHFVSAYSVVCCTCGTHDMLQQEVSQQERLQHRIAPLWLFCGYPNNPALDFCLTATRPGIQRQLQSAAMFIQVLTMLHGVPDADWHGVGASLSHVRLAASSTF